MAPADVQSLSEPDHAKMTQDRIRSDQTAVASCARVVPPQRGFGPPVEAGEVGTLGPYRIVKQLGKGGMGAVYAAVDTRLDRRLALKVMLPECAADADAKGRFLREASAAAQISHDNVVTVFEADERDGVPYIAMQFLEGYPLDEFLRKKGAPTVPQVLRLGRETAAGLAAAHKLGLVHRDIKPGNLWLEAPNGRVKVLDFGLAKPLHADIELTQSGIVVGTPAYMSPEQARGVKVDARSDLFSLGTVLYRLCTNRLPFDGPTTMAVLMALGADEPAPVRELNPAVPEPLAVLIHQLLAKDPDDRPASAAEVAKRLQAIANSTGASQVVVSPAPRVVYLPVQVTAGPAANPFANLDATEIEPVTPAAPAASAARAPKKKRRVPLVWPAVGLVGLLALTAAAAAVAVKGRGRDEPKEDAQSPAPKSKPAPAKPPAAADPDRTAADWILSIGGAVRVNGEERDIRSAAELPKDRFALTGANLTERTFTDADLARLKGCAALTHVWLHGTKATDAGLAHLKGLSGLTSLSLAHTGVTDAGLAHLKAFPALVELWAQCTAVTDAGLVHLKEVPALARLDLSNTKVTDAGLANLATCELTFLNLNGTAVAGPGLVHLKERKGLTLQLDATPMTDAGLPHLKELGGLVELALSETKITDAGLPHLRGLRGLSVLYVRRTPVTLKGLGELHAFIPGCRIECNGGYIVAFDVNRLAACWALSVDGTVRVNGQTKDIKTPDGLPKGPFTLTSVELQNQAVTDADLARLKPCTGLTRLLLSGTGISDTGMAHLAEIKALTELGLASTQVTDAGLAHLKELKRLDKLNLAGTAVTDTGLANLSGHAGVRHLDLRKTQVSENGLRRLHAAGPWRRVVYNGGTFEPDNADRSAAEWVLSVGGTVRLADLKNDIKDVKDLPSEPFILTHANLSDRQIRDEDLVRFAGCRGLTVLVLHETKVTDDALVHLENLTRLQLLSLTGTEVTDAGLARLKEHKTLTALHLTGTRVTDAGLAHLKELRELTNLLVSMTQVTDAGLVHLKELNKLTDLELNQTQVTVAGVAEFQAAVPKCKVRRSVELNK